MVNHNFKTIFIRISLLPFIKVGLLCFHNRKIFVCLRVKAIFPTLKKLCCRSEWIYPSNVYLQITRHKVAWSSHFLIEVSNWGNDSKTLSSLQAVSLWFLLSRGSRKKRISCSLDMLSSPVKISMNSVTFERMSSGNCTASTRIMLSLSHVGRPRRGGWPGSSTTTKSMTKYRGRWTTLQCVFLTHEESHLLHRNCCVL